MGGAYTSENSWKAIPPSAVFRFKNGLSARTAEPFSGNNGAVATSIANPNINNSWGECSVNARRRALNKSAECASAHLSAR